MPDLRSPALAAIDMRGVPPSVLSWERIGDGIALDGLPIRIVDNPLSSSATAAVVSWRWDADPGTRRSRNLALALRYARDAGFQDLFVDIVSVDQGLPKTALLHSVVGLANLFAAIPVIAAYDESDGTTSDWSRTLMRPWILSEIRAYCQNPTRVTHVGYCVGEAVGRDLSFANEVSVIRSGGYATCIFGVLSEWVKMTDIADFRYILAELTEPVAACYGTFGRADYLLAVFLLTARYEREQIVDRGGPVNYGFRLDVHDPKLDSMGLERFTLGPYLASTPAFESARALLLDGHEVAMWRSKMTSSYDRNWIEVLPDAEDHIFDAIGLSPGTRRQYKERSGLRTAFLHIDKNAPHPSVCERAANLSAGRWLEKMPSPRGITLGFDSELWRCK